MVSFLFMKLLARLYRYINLLSLDVAGGAAISALFFAKAFNVVVYPQGICLLALTVWLVYTADHLLDARRVPHEASSPRHQFHQRHFVILFFCVVAVALLCLALVFYVRPSIIQAGLGFSVGVVLYLLVSHKLVRMKEWLGGLFYAGGVMLPVWAVKQATFSWAEILLMAQFLGVVWINLVLFAWFSYAEDRADKLPSLVTALGLKRSEQMLIVLFCLQGLLLCWPVGFGSERIILIAMTAALLILFVKPAYFSKQEKFRWVGDGIFFLPLIYLLA